MSTAAIFGALFLFPLRAGSQQQTSSPQPPPRVETPVRDRYLGRERPGNASPFDPVFVAPQGRSVGNIEVSEGRGGATKFEYERSRIKRTVPLDAASRGAQGRLTPLASSRRTGTTYFDWDDDYYYLAHETETPADVRFELDGLGDGWLRGADNVAVQVSTARGVFNSGDRVAALLLNAARDKDTARWERLPVPARDLKVEAGNLSVPPYTYIVQVAIPRSDAIALKTNEKGTVGLRVQVAPREALTTNSDFISTRPFYKLNLSESVGASGGGLSTTLKVIGQKERQSGDNVKARLAVKNTGSKAVRPTRFFVQGYLSDRKLVGNEDFSGEEIRPGRTFQKDVELTVQPDAKEGAIALVGGAEISATERVGALASLEKVGNATVTIQSDGKSIKGGKTTRKEIEVIVRYFAREPAYGDLTLKLPTGFFTDGDPNRRFSLTFPTQRRSIKYKIIVPELAEPGLYRVDAELTINGKKFTDTTNLRLESSGR